ncbi:TipC family immunity protein [Streptococcus australis]|uniref:TipC family immunity protein n=1 Tax=Streptococcus australis TaxID=113107 RepID=UPI002331095E|nr:TipC family immunity protein [Streptococcus australis]MDB8641972.1 TipC family immunity protein [Streptococcus australis]MDB8645639.1 TipC family immunity protein [Streptococcus australis]
MNKKKIFLWLSPFILFALYWLGIYWSLRNPMEEINYAENGSWVRYLMFRPFTETIGSDRIWKEDEGFQMYPYSDEIVGGQEDLSVMMFRDSSEWVYWYKYRLDENASVRMTFKYNSKKRALIQEEAYLYVDDQTVEGSDFLQKLSTYGKDRTWLQRQSKKVAEQYILGTWFKNGSSRYSLKNLGDMTIQYNELVKEK